MKLTPLFALLAALFAFVGCNSSSDSAASSAESKPMGDAEEASAGADSTAEDGLLMDQYLTGEIPGFKDDQ